MISFKIVSKKHGEFDCLVDDQDFELVKSFGNGSGKWCLSLNRGKFYAQKRTSSGVVYLHRLLSGAPAGKYVDHVNGNSLDNTRGNLRVVKNSTNLRNGRVRPNNTTGVNGVSYDKRRGKWYARIRVDYRYIYLGRFGSLEQATEARKKAEEKYWSV